MNRAWLLGIAVATLGILSGCSQESADNVELAPVLSLPDSTDGTSVPLDAADGFPFRVMVCTTSPQGDAGTLQGALQAHVWLSSGVGGSTVPTGTAVTDSTFTLERSGPSNTNGKCSGYSAIVTLDAPGPGPVVVSAEIDGALTHRCAVIGPIPVESAQCALPGTGNGDAGRMALIALSPPVELSDWNGNSPRYTVCAETLAAKGSVTLTSYDPGIVSASQAPLSGTLMPGPCTAPTEVANLHGVSHVNFDVTAVPPALSGPPPETPLTLIATLAGQPVTQSSAEDPYVWTATRSIGANPPIVTLEIVSFRPATSFVSTQVDLPAGQLFELVVHASHGEEAADASVADADTDAGMKSQPIEGLTVSFAATGGATFTPASATTDAQGNASSYVVVPYGTPTNAVVSGAGVVVLSRSSAVPPRLMLTPPSFSTSTVLDGGVRYLVSTTAELGDGGSGSDSTTREGGATPSDTLQGLSVTFTFAPSNTGITPSTETAVTNAKGEAQVGVFVPGTVTTDVTAVVAGGNAVGSNTTPPSKKGKP